MNIPNIRFNGFSDPWKQQKLSDFMDFSNGFNGNAELYGHGIPYISVMDILNNDYISYDCIRGKVDINNETLKRFSVEYGDVLFQRSSENPEDAGSSNVYIGQNNVAFGGFVIRGKKKVEYNVFYMKHLLDSSSVRRQIISKAQGAQHINVSQEILSDVEISIPFIGEQDKIGQIFYNLDNLITLHQQAYDKTKELKKYMLQKMFPQIGESVPEIRIAGFSDAWEQRKFNEYISLRMGHLFSPSDYVVNGKYNVVTISNVKGERFIDVTGMNQIDDLPNNINEYQILKSGDMLISLTGNIGRVSYNIGDNNILNYRVGKIEFNKLKIDNKYVYAFLCQDSIIKGFIDKGQGGAQPNISKPEVENLSIWIPSELEQEKIGCFFENIDNLITLHQRKYNQLKKFKKYLLQQMFV